MSKFILSLALLVLALSSANSKLLGASPSPSDYKYAFEIKSKADLPRNFTWGNVEGKNYLTRMRNQHIPQYCGSCWAQASSTFMSDRISVMRKGAFPEINMAPQTLLDFDYVDQGCHGGDFRPAFEYISKHGIVDEACSEYRALGWDIATTGDVQPRCKDCADGTCFMPKEYNEYTVSEHGEIPWSEEAIMTEIHERGPVGCGVYAPPLEDVATGFTGVFETNKTGEIDHAISLVGWGQEETTGKPYWVLRNSWGEYFADQGFIKIYRGNNTIRVEEQCYYAIPKNTWQNHKYPNVGKEKTALKVENLLLSLNQYNSEQHVAEMVKKFGSYKGSLNKSKDYVAHITGPQPKDYVNEDQLPARFWWGDVDGSNYLSWTVNQHIPQYCGSCWAQAAVGAMSDRINILHNNIDRRFLSAQVLINCGVGDCVQGGDAGVAYAWIKKHNIPEYACQNYIAMDPPAASCSDIQKCMNCPSFGAGPCFAQKTYTSWNATQHGKVSGALDMKKELWARGSLACNINATNDFYYNYKGGIYSSKDKGETNHVVTLVGWGKSEAGEEFWIVRNSWGTYWGENGYFRLKMYEDNLNFEQECDWAVPSEVQVDLNEVLADDN